MEKVLKINRILITVFLLFISYSFACTNIIVTKEASKDQSVIITYACDGEFHPHLKRFPAKDYQDKDSLEIKAWSGKIVGKIAQVKHTYAYVGLMNEHQLSIGETTFSGREELYNPDGILHYWDLMQLALQRAKTAREAVIIMTNLVEQYGYRATGESISIADKNEVWILEIIGKGPGNKGAVWVARKVPDGYVSCHANKARIGEFPLNEPENCLYSPDVISFAVEKGYYDPNSTLPFRFCDVYCPPTARNKRYASTRVWNVFRQVAPSKNFSPDYHRNRSGAKPYPLWIKPDKKLSVKDVMNLMRDHYEDTKFDMTKGIASGPFNTPNRWRSIEWQIDNQDYMWERPISTQQTGFSFVSQSRSHLPDQIGGVYWYGVDDTYTTSYIPLYCCIDKLPKSYTVGNIQEFSWDSAWWVFNFVANFANLKYSYMIEDIQDVQRKIEDHLFNSQFEIEKNALKLLKEKQTNSAVNLLTEYSVTKGEETFKKWQKLSYFLITKYNDGYIKNSNGNPEEKGYPENWLRKVVKEEPEKYKIPKKNNIPETKLVD